MPKYIFEPMTPSELVSTLVGWGHPCTESQLEHPKTDFVERIYFVCLEQLTTLDSAALEEPVRQAMENVETNDQDFYLDPLVHNLLVYHLGRVARAARLEKFSAKDLSNPTANRTSDILSAFINFIKFVQVNCRPYIDDVQAQSRKIVIERDEVAHLIEERKRDIQALRDRMALDKPRCDALEKENSDLLNQIVKMKQEQAARNEEFVAARTEKHAALSRKDDLNREYAQVENRLNETKARVVHDPESIKRSIAMLSTKVQDEKRNLSAKDATSRELQSKITMLGRIDQNVKTLLEQARVIEREDTMLEESRREVAELQQALAVQNSNSEDFHDRRKRSERQLANAREKLERAQKHAEDKRTASSKTIERLQSEYDQMNLERRDNDKQLEGLKKEAHDIEAQMAEHLRASEIEINDLLKAYWDLRHSTDVYMRTLSEKLKMNVRKAR
ncbi:Nuf2 family-domain-containing protein [Flagelloscypha sp. PMI_526]|nr:Nuf2 family-domain-containing protein [Flagelloscypha sp. PMI_526]